MTIEEQKTTRLRTLEEWFKGNIHAFDDITAPDIVYHAPPQPDVLGKEAYKKYMADVTNAFSGVRFTAQRYMMDEHGDAVLYTMQGALTGQLPGFPVPPTGKEVTMTGIIMTHIVNGKAVEQWSYFDVVGLMQQLGAKL